MKPPGNATAPGPLAQLTLRQAADRLYPAIDPKHLSNTVKDQVALVTGSTRGIGQEIARALAQAGYSVAITGRNEEEVQQTAKDIQVAHPSRSIVGVSADGCNLADLQRLADKVKQLLGPIDVLICNAGTNTFMPFAMTTAHDWWSSLEINLKSPTELTRIVLPEMRERNSGTIVYTSSRAAVADLPWTTAYGAGKTAITRFAACLQNELDQTQAIDFGHQINGISLFSIHPGEVETSLHKTAFPAKTKTDAPYIVEFMKGLEVKRPHFEASLAAWTCVFLASGKGDKLRGRYVDCTRDIEEQIALL